MVKRDEGFKKKKMTKAELEEVLIENFINLQKVLTNLSVKFDELSSNMSKMLQLFEISAKSFADKYSGDEIKSSGNVDKDFLDKLDSLLDQNKTISKGIMMMEERVRGRAPSAIGRIGERRPPVGSRPLPRY